jgi:hypothetical protein
MNFITAKAALYVSAQSNVSEIQQQALDYCQTHDYALTAIYHDTGNSQPVLHTVKEAMEERAFHLLLIPSVDHLYGSQLGYLLNFLIDAQESRIDVVCLQPQPTNLFAQGLAIVPQQAEYATNLDEVIHCLRYR